MEGMNRDLRGLLSGLIRGQRGLVVGLVPCWPQLPRQWPCCLLCGWLQTHSFLQVLIFHREERCSSLVSPPSAVPEEGTGSAAGRGPASLAPLPSSFPAGSRPHPGVSHCPPLLHSQRASKARLWACPGSAMEGGAPDDSFLLGGNWGM